MESALRREAFIRIPEQRLVEFLGGGGTLQCAGLPTGAEVVAVAHDFETRSFKVMMKHPQFYPVPEGNAAPCLGVVEFVYLMNLQLDPFICES